MASEMKEYFDERMRPLVGGRIYAAGGVEMSDGTIWPSLAITLESEEEVVISMSQDSEGNGPGWFFLESISDLVESDNDDEEGDGE